LRCQVHHLVATEMLLVYFLTRALSHRFPQHITIQMPPVLNNQPPSNILMLRYHYCMGKMIGLFF
jgi:hypothetical protein